MFGVKFNFDVFIEIISRLVFQMESFQLKKKKSSYQFVSREAKMCMRYKLKIDIK